MILIRRVLDAMISVLIDTSLSIVTYPGAKIVIICCFFLHFFQVNADSVHIQLLNYYVLAAIAVTQGITLLSYPLLGWLADNCFTRYKLVKLSAVLLLVAAIVGVAFELVNIAFLRPMVGFPLQSPLYKAFTVLEIMVLVLHIVSVGMFESNAIQFGMDQMLEASSHQLSTFIHWYYWSMPSVILFCHFFQCEQLLQQWAYVYCAAVRGTSKLSQLDKIPSSSLQSAQIYLAAQVS